MPLPHTAVQTAIAVVTSVASGVTFAELINAVGGIVLAVLGLASFALGIARTNKKNKQLAQRERRQMYRRGYRRGYMTRDRELQPVVTLEAYWRSYIAEVREDHPQLPAPSPPTVVLPPAPPDLGPDEDTDDDDEGDDA